MSAVGEAQNLAERDTGQQHVRDPHSFGREALARAGKRNGASQNASAAPAVEQRTDRPATTAAGESPNQQDPADVWIRPVRREDVYSGGAASASTSPPRGQLINSGGVRRPKPEPPRFLRVAAAGELAASGRRSRSRERLGSADGAIVARCDVTRDIGGSAQRQAPTRTFGLVLGGACGRDDDWLLEGAQVDPFGPVVHLVRAGLGYAADHVVEEFRHVRGGV